LKIEDIKPGAKNLTVIGKILSKEPVPLSTKRLVKAVLADETGSIILNLWGPQADACEVGDLVKIVEAYAKTRGGKLELNTWKEIQVLKNEE
jgi:ssDNA-binding replication factor A large subunit